MVVGTYADKAGNWYEQSDTVQLDKVAGDNIPMGRLLFRDDTVDKWKQTVDGTEFGPFAVSVDPAPVGTLKVHVADEGSEVMMEVQGALEPNCDVMPGTRPGTIRQYAAPTVGGTYSQAEVTAVLKDEYRRVGRYRGKTNNNVRDGGVCPPAADTEIVIIKLRGGHPL
jgi:hypothetical protein